MFGSRQPVKCVPLQVIRATEGAPCTMVQLQGTPDAQARAKELIEAVATLRISSGISKAHDSEECSEWAPQPLGDK